MPPPTTKPHFFLYPFSIASCPTALLMGFWNFFTRTSTKPSQAATRQLALRQQSFFLDPALHRHYVTHGWCTVGNVVTNEEIEAFLATYQEITALPGFNLSDTFLNSGRLHNPEIRSKVHAAINKGASTILPRMFAMEHVDTRTGGAFQVKPPSDKSELQIHQDSSVIDEDNDYCLFVWIPLCDVTMQNGPLHFLEGSHLWGNTQRSLGVPWNFEKHDALLKAYMKPVTAKRGDVIIFDPAMLHSSSPNFTDALRCAITLTVLRKNYQLVYFFKNENTPKDKIEKYRITEEFYKDYDFVAQPDGSRFPMTLEAYNPFDLTAKEMKELVLCHLPKA